MEKAQDTPGPTGWPCVCLALPRAGAASLGWGPTLSHAHPKHQNHKPDQRSWLRARHPAASLQGGCGPGPALRPSRVLREGTRRTVSRREHELPAGPQAAPAWLWRRGESMHPHQGQQGRGHRTTQLQAEPPASCQCDGSVATPRRSSRERSWRSKGTNLQSKTWRIPGPKMGLGG